MKKYNLIYTILAISFALAIVIIFCTSIQHTQSVDPGNTSTQNQGITIDINTATVEQLTYLPGIGNNLAEKIIDYREQVGGFQHIEDIMNVDGIGANTFNEISKYLSVGGSK